MSAAGKVNAAVPKRPIAKTPAATDFNNMTSTSSRQGLGEQTARAYLSAFAHPTAIWMQQLACFFTKISLICFLTLISLLFVSFL
tara:strand:- start:20238 stop:20492 length:255 start_codon:yes stop_codon:yes gene_type:complete